MLKISKQKFPGKSEEERKNFVGQINHELRESPDEKDLEVIKKRDKK